MTHLEAAYDAVRAHLHGHRTDLDAERDDLRSLLWLVAEAVERAHGIPGSGMALRDLGDDLTGEVMSPGLRRLLDG